MYFNNQKSLCLSAAIYSLAQSSTDNSWGLIDGVKFTKFSNSLIFFLSSLKPADRLLSIVFRLAEKPILTRRNISDACESVSSRLGFGLKTTICESTLGAGSK